MTTLAAASGPTRSPARRPDRPGWALLLTLSGNMILDSIEVSVMLIALPTIGRSLELSLTGAQWLMAGFALGFAAVLPLGPMIAARWGRRRLYLVAMAIFAAASVVGGLTDSVALLIASRVVKGACAAVTAPTGLAIITTTFTDPRQQRRAISIYSLFGAAGFTAGLLLSGALLTAGWHWTFLFPAPLSVALLVFGLAVLPPDSPGPDGPAAAAAAAGPRRALPLLRDGALRRATLGAASLNGTYISLLLLIVFQLDRWSPWRTALALLPACLPLAVAAPFAGRMIARFPTARLIAAGALTSLLGGLLYLCSPDHSAYLTAILPTLVLVEIGFVLSFTALNAQATATIAVGDRGRAVPLYQTGVQLGAATMLPLVALLLGLGHGQRPALALICAVGGLGLLTALTGLRRPRGRRPAADVGDAGEVTDAAGTTIRNISR
ncbi:MFS transporter [Frankia gtarii]|uniref:MFS transporter n=1 Tax=Frankia gtarii TaxID=2950102 RepID=UPI0021C20E46|nr:MFS transporter [Frankia gtarii]